MTTEQETSTLRTGQLIPNFRLSAVNRKGQIGPWDYKQHRNLVLIFFRSAECRKCKQALREIAEHYGDYKEKEAEVLAISTDELDRLRQLAQDLRCRSRYFQIATERLRTYTSNIRKRL